jgi:hypothetical protein
MTHSGLINTQTNLISYFHEAIGEASEKNHLDIGEHTHWYLTNLLDSYSRPDTFFDHREDGGNLTPLAEYYIMATEAGSDTERRLYLQRLGDVAIVVSGFFAAALRRKTINLNYYMAMGENAYGFLAETSGVSTREKVLTEVFDDLSRHFEAFVSMLSSITHDRSKVEDVLTLFDTWQSTGEPAIARQLRARGVMLDSSDQAH